MGNDRHFDAIVVGSGMTGGWAAKELTEAGLRTLVLEAGAISTSRPTPVTAWRSTGPSATGTSSAGTTTSSASSA
jgi:choline dehydrogenase-like flavoprotein